MAGALHTALAIALWLASSVIFGLLGLWVLRAIFRERPRPTEPRDDMLGDLPNVPRLTNPVRVDAFHARSK